MLNPASLVAQGEKAGCTHPTLDRPTALRSPGFRVCPAPAGEPASLHRGLRSVSQHKWSIPQLLGVGAGTMRMLLEGLQFCRCLGTSNTSSSGAQLFLPLNLAPSWSSALGSVWRAHSAVAPRRSVVRLSRLGSRPALAGPGPASRALSTVAHNPGWWRDSVLPSGPQGGGRLSSLKPSARHSGLTPGSCPAHRRASERMLSDTFSAPRCLPRGRARVKVSALSVRSATPWR